MLPIFYQPATLTENTRLVLEAETSRHIIQVLRKQPGDQLMLTNGAGARAVAVLDKADKKRCEVTLLTIERLPRRQPDLHMAVSFTRNAGRNEWLLEKVTEMGVRTIIPVISARTERDKIRYDRWHNILVSAMIQSQQFYLPELHEALSFKAMLDKFKAVDQKLVAHCMDQPVRRSIASALEPGRDTLLLIGPEGDFTPEEVALCAAQAYAGLSLGQTRLRTETAAMVACAYFNQVN